ncbi:MAG: hypothetical protein GW827_10785 [Flavobacteriales bacterium]|nr:hypothetical protein [Flavobacteriales bacterium]NCQ14868.1 hypothetical protein [Flavobacteriales bacterium]
MFNKTNLSKRKLSKPLLENLFKAAIKFLVKKYIFGFADNHVHKSNQTNNLKDHKDAIV